jgi:hypothetical protein
MDGEGRRKDGEEGNAVGAKADRGFDDTDTQAKIRPAQIASPAGILP